MHKDNSFVTLTYNDENLPSDGSLRKSELQNFMKALRHKFEGQTIRFFGCGEYGEKYDRPHYHVALFGCDFPDKEIHEANFRNKRNPDVLYISSLLSEVWKKGFHTVGELNFKTAGYVARYVTKKHMGKLKDFVYDGLEPEFALMSRGQKKGGLGGIGKQWFEKYYTDCYPKDYIVVNGKKHKPPRYYDALLEKKNKEMYNYVMAKRELEAFKAKPESDKRLYQKDRYRKKVTQRLNRRLETCKR